MSDTNTYQDTADQNTQDGQGFDDSQQQGSPDDQGSLLGEYSQSQYNPFLESVEEAHRETVAPYLKKWDANATRRFQELQSRYSPYEQLNQQYGDEALQQAVEVYQTLMSDPQAVYEALAETYGQDFDEYEDQGDYENDEQKEAPQYGELPPEVLQRLERNDTLLEHVASFILQQQEMQTHAQEDQALDGMLENLKTEFGDFDEDYVLTKMYNGMEPAKAVQSWQNLIQKQVNQAMGSQNVFTPLSGSGSTAAPDNTPVTQASRNSIKSLVADLMKQSSGG